MPEMPDSFIWLSWLWPTCVGSECLGRPSTDYADYTARLARPQRLWHVEKTGGEGYIGTLVERAGAEN